jgi:hypothetical protein
MTTFNEYDVVRLTRPLPEHGLVEGARGAVLMVFAESEPASYEVEFLNAAGETIALLTLPENALCKG